MASPAPSRLERCGWRRDSISRPGRTFHPDYASNGFFFVYYNASVQPTQVTRLVRYQVSTDPDLADPGSAQLVIEIDQPGVGHNGGWIGFGPDGYLVLPLGDGGAGGLPSQDIENLHGSALRLDVDGDDFPGDPDRNYAIPPDNPFVGEIGVGEIGAGEIWLYGLRNPFRASFDRLTGDFTIGDVGEDSFEEVNFQPASSAGGKNYGWCLREGYGEPPPCAACCPGPLPGRTDPVHAYAHGTGAGQGSSITGGSVYRGPIAGLVGRYFFGDYENERIWSIQHDGSTVTEFIDWTDAFAPPPGHGTIDEIVAFGEDAAGNLYIVDLGGEIFRVVPAGAVPAVPAPGFQVLMLLLAVAGLWQLAANRAR